MTTHLRLKSIDAFLNHADQDFADRTRQLQTDLIMGAIEHGWSIDELDAILAAHGAGHEGWRARTRADLLALLRS